LIPVKARALRWLLSTIHAAMDQACAARKQRARQSRLSL